MAYTGVWFYDSPAFCVGYTPSQLGTEIVTASVNGSHRHVLVPSGSNGGGLVNSNYGVNLTVAFSPNGRQLAYAGPITSVSAPAITIIDAKTGKRRRTIGLSFPSSGLAWGSSGELAYTTGTIDAMRADGSHRRQITNGGRGTDSDPNWSPDGKRLAFLRDVQTLVCIAPDRAAPIARPADSNCSQVDHTDVYVVAADGSHLKRLTYFGQATGPVWSPDGKQIAFYDNNGTSSPCPPGVALPRRSQPAGCSPLTGRHYPNRVTENGGEADMSREEMQLSKKESALLRALAAEPTACTAVGNYTDTSSNYVTLAEHWDGSRWSIQPTPTPTGGGQLLGVSCTSTTACTAVGSNPGGPLAEIWDGNNWSIQTTPSTTATGGGRLNGISCTSATACIAVGSGPNGPLAEIWDGNGWSIQNTPSPSPLGSAYLTAVSCASATTCTAVGAVSMGSQAAFAEVWDGSSWSIQSTPNPTGPGLSSVSCTSTAACIAVGLAFGRPFTERYF